MTDLDIWDYLGEGKLGFIAEYGGIILPHCLWHWGMHQF